MKLKVLLKKYVSEKSLYNSSGTISFYESHIPFLLKGFSSDIEVESISKDSVISFIKTAQARGISNNTINHRLGILKAACRFYGLKDLEFYSLKKLPVVFRTYGFLDKSKQLTISTIVNELYFPYRVMICLFLDTGVRLSELINIELANVDFQNRNIYLTKTKTNHSRYVYFTKETLDLLILYVPKNCHLKFLDKDNLLLHLDILPMF